jgi:hypothetical protein
VVLANERCGACDFGDSSERVHLVGVSISFEKIFYRLSFTPPSGRLIGPSPIKVHSLVMALFSVLVPSAVGNGKNTYF